MERLFGFLFRDYKLSQEIRELNSPYFIYGVISMDWELMNKVFDPVKRFNPKGMDR